MSIVKYFLFFLIFQAAFLQGKSQGNAIGKIKLTTVAQVNHGASYITFPTDIGNIEPLWFEGNIVPAFYLRVRDDSRLMGVVIPQIILRMYQKESLPVQTPSYMPQIVAYYLLNSKAKANSMSLFGKIAHHSNGQDGAFYLPNGEINTLSCSFATNFYEIGFIKTNYRPRYYAVQFLSTSLEVHPNNLSIPELKGIYSDYRFNTIFSIFKIPKDELNKSKKASFSIKAKSVWMFGKINNLAPLSLNRLNLSLTLYYHPKFFEDIGFFAQIYHGMDYYNIYFNHQISILRFGIMTEKIRF